MTDTQVKVEIPADVKDNSPRTVRVRWRDTRQISQHTLEDDLYWAREVFGFTVHQWEDVDREQQPVTLTRIVNERGCTRELYETSYFTRVPCAECEYSYASVYQTIVDEDGEVIGPVPRCDTHAHIFRKLTQREGVTLYESERLRIGQH